MKQAKHTPNWSVVFNGDKSITLKHWEKLNPCKNDAHYEQINEQDARLIAAAPDMLVALEVAVRRLEEIRYQKASDKQIEFLKEVIAKARGES